MLKEIIELRESLPLYAGTKPEVERWRIKEGRVIVRHIVAPTNVGSSTPGQIIEIIEIEPHNTGNRVIPDSIIAAVEYIIQDSSPSVFIAVNTLCAAVIECIILNNGITAAGNRSPYTINAVPQHTTPNI
jgi:hypothetical protein